MLKAIALKEVKELVELSGAALDRSLNMGRGKPNMFLLQNHAQDLGNNVRTLLNGFGVSMSRPDKGSGKDDDVMKVIMEAMGGDSISKDETLSLINDGIEAAFKKYMPKAD